jgi:hypothetical protein
LPSSQYLPCFDIPGGGLSIADLVTTNYGQLIAAAYGAPAKEAGPNVNTIQATRLEEIAAK